jgi:hypothetical protein
MYICSKYLRYCSGYVPRVVPYSYLAVGTQLLLLLLLSVNRGTNTTAFAWTSNSASATKQGISGCYRTTSFLSTTVTTTSTTGTTRTLRRQPMTLSETVSASESTTASPSVVVLPKLPLPPPICSNVVGTWAYDTMSRRIGQEILCNIVWHDCADDLSQLHFLSIRDAIMALRTELQFAATTPLTLLPSLPPVTAIPDANLQQQQQQQQSVITEWEQWNTILQPYVVETHDTWLSAPWLMTEFYLYRRLMQCLDYWNPQSAGYMYDPFRIQKRNGLITSTGNAEPALTKLQHVSQQPPPLPTTTVVVDRRDRRRRDDDDDDDTTTTTTIQTGLLLAIQLSLWGNKMDLSLWPADVQAANTDVFTSILEQASTNLLHDDSTILNEYCQTLRRRNVAALAALDGSSSSPPTTNIDIIVDNAGFELVTDLALAQYLIESGIAGTVTFQMKSHPTFVSDALIKDLYETVEYYENLDRTKYPACVYAGQQWRKLLNSGQWVCVEHSFWVQPLAMWDMYESLRSELQSRCNLAFVKGDANYRRLLGDREWDLSAPFEDVVGCYFPVPVCALRTLKAEIGCGMDPQQIERAASLDQNWMTNGRFGVVHFGQGSKRT